VIVDIALSTAGQSETIPRDDRTATARSPGAFPDLLCPRHAGDILDRSETHLCQADFQGEKKFIFQCAGGLSFRLARRPAGQGTEARRASGRRLCSMERRGGPGEKWEPRRQRRKRGEYNDISNDDPLVARMARSPYRRSKIKSAGRSFKLAGVMPLRSTGLSRRAYLRARCFSMSTRFQTIRYPAAYGIRKQPIFARGCGRGALRRFQCKNCGRL